MALAPQSVSVHFLNTVKNLNTKIIGNCSETKQFYSFNLIYYRSK
jgi:hypothetical protein